MAKEIQKSKSDSSAPSGRVHPLVRQLVCKVKKHRITGYPPYWAISINGRIWGDYGYDARGKTNAEEALRRIQPVLNHLNKQGWLTLPNKEAH